MLQSALDPAYAIVSLHVVVAAAADGANWVTATANVPNTHTRDATAAKTRAAKRLGPADATM
jgi:hypothetical protein